MKRLACLLVLCALPLGGCLQDQPGSGTALLGMAAGMTAGLDVWSNSAIMGSTPEERVQIRSTLVALRPFTDRAAAMVNEKIALIDGMAPAPPE